MHFEADMNTSDYEVKKVKVQGHEETKYGGNSGSGQIHTIYTQCLESC